MILLSELILLYVFSYLMETYCYTLAISRFVGQYRTICCDLCICLDMAGKSYPNRRFDVLFYGCRSLGRCIGGFYYQNDAIVQQLDRPPLSLWLGSWLKHYGFSSTQSLQMVARIGLSGVFASFVVYFGRSYSLFTTFICVLFLSRASSFVRLSVWLNAQMICNFFFALHMCYGAHLIASNRKTWQWTIVGFFGGAAIASKEQGILLVLTTLCFLFIQFILSSQRFMNVKKLGYYIVGCIPLTMWYLYWFQNS